MAKALHQIVLAGKTILAGETFTAAKDVMAELIAEGAASDGKSDTASQTAKGDDPFDVPDGYAVTEKGGGWYEVTGPEGFEPIKAHGAEDLRETLSLIAAGDDQAPAS